jgi:hypothetical protein
LEAIDKDYLALVDKFAKLDEKGITRMRLTSKNADAVDHFLTNCKLLGYDVEEDYDSETKEYIARIQV